MTADPLVLLPALNDATGRLLRNVTALDPTAIAGPSLLPDWTRGHVLAHLARNADSQVRMLTSAREGTLIRQYPSAASRAADIEAGATRPLAEHLDDLRASADRLAEAITDFPPARWAEPVLGLGDVTMPAARLVWGRLREVEVHHVDLAIGYAPAAWDTTFTLHLLQELATGFTAAPLTRLHAVDLDRELTIGSAVAVDATAAPAQPLVTVSGPGHALAAWLIGRASGTDLAVTPPGPLPAVPPWK